MCFYGSSGYLTSAFSHTPTHFACVKWASGHFDGGNLVWQVMSSCSRMARWKLCNAHDDILISWLTSYDAIYKYKNCQKMCAVIFCMSRNILAIYHPHSNLVIIYAQQKSKTLIVSHSLSLSPSISLPIHKYASVESAQKRNYGGSLYLDNKFRLMLAHPHFLFATFFYCWSYVYITRKKKLE
jgi:hypothetical protein